MVHATPARSAPIEIFPTFTRPHRIRLVANLWVARISQWSAIVMAMKSRKRIDPSDPGSKNRPSSISLDIARNCGRKPDGFDAIQWLLRLLSLVIGFLLFGLPRCKVKLFRRLMEDLQKAIPHTVHLGSGSRCQGDAGHEDDLDGDVFIREK